MSTMNVDELMDGMLVEGFTNVREEAHSGNIKAVIDDCCNVYIDFEKDEVHMDGVERKGFDIMTFAHLMMYLKRNGMFNLYITVDEVKWTVDDFMLSIID